MSAVDGQVYYAKKPTPAAPCTVLVGPFHGESSARRALLDDVKRSEEDLPKAAGWGEYQFFELVATVQPVVSLNVQLKTLP